MDLFTVLAHEGEEVVENLQPSLDEIVRTNSINYTFVSAGLIFLLVVLAKFFKDKSEVFKVILFGALVLVILANTIYLAGSTIYLNQQSTTGGPVHWHADYQIWNCGKQIELKDPEGFSNKVGTETVHEHNDNRMHIEGVILDFADSSPHHFFESLGGSMSNTHLTIPTEEGVVTMKNGQNCPDGRVGMFQVFVYQTKNGVVSQRKLEDSESYQITQTGNVPPGDCLIFEFDSNIKDKTDKLCTSYETAKETGKIHVE